MDYYSFSDSIITTTSNDSVQLGIVMLLASILAIWFINRHQGRRFHRIFNVPGNYSLIGLDLGKIKKNKIKPLYLSFHNVTGVADAVFINRFKRSGIIGEVKSRKHKSKISDYELYQIMLYMGLMKDKYNLKFVKAVIRYKDKAVEIGFNNDLYQHLLELREEIIQSRDGWFPVDSRPLAQRRQAQEKFAA